jgi:peptide/nickel transport system permease protein
MTLGAGTTRIFNRTGQALLTLASVVVLVFLLVRLIPGDPVATILGSETTPEAEAALRGILGLDKPLWRQFTDYVAGVLQGDLGLSAVQRGETVAHIIMSSLPNTLAIVVTGMLLSLIFGVGFGLAAALSRWKAVDLLVRTWVMLLYATPTFLIALLLILVFAIQLGWFPAGGWAGTYPENFAYLVLPGFALSGHLGPIIARTVRQSAIGASEQLFMEAALSRGLSRRALNLHHILPNSILPVITLLGISFGSLLTGAIIVEAVFGLPGLGSEMTKAVARRDYPVIQGIALVAAVAVVIGNLLAEFAYTYVDPRARTAA